MAETLAYELIARDVNASRTFDRVGDAIDDAGKSTQHFTADQKQLAQQVEQTELKLKALYRGVGDGSDTALNRIIRREQARLALLKTAQKQLEEIGPEAGTASGKGFISAFSDALSGLPSQLKGAGIVTAVALAPFLVPSVGAAVGGAVLGGVGLGGIIGGVAAAAQDQRVKDAGSQLGQNFLGGFRDAGRIFIGPVLDQMSTLQRTEDIVLADLAAGFAKLAPVVAPLAKGLEGLADNLNLDEAFGDALPAVRAIAHELPEIGDAFGDMFHSIGEGSDGATEGLITVLHATEDLIRFTGDFIHVASDSYEWLVRNGHAATQFGIDILDTADALGFLSGGLSVVAVDKYRGHLEALHDETGSLIEGLDDAKRSGDDWSGNLSEQARSAKEAADEAKAYTDALETLFGIQMSLDEAQIRYQQSIDETLKALKEGKRTLDINTKDGQDHAKAILYEIRAIEDLREANIANKMEVADANAAADGQIARLETTLIRLGYNKQAIHDLIDAYIELKRKAYVETHVDDKSVQIAYNHVKAVEAEMDRLNGNVSTIFVRTVFGEFRAGERNPSGRAGGGMVMAGHSYQINENGPELVEFGRNGRVIPAGASAAMMRGAAAPAASGTVDVKVTVDPAGAHDALGQAIAQMLRVDAGFRATVASYVAA